MKHKKNKRPQKVDWQLIVLKVLATVSIGLLLVTSIGFLGRIAWFFDIFVNFRFQYTWIAVILLAGTLFIKDKLPKLKTATVVTLLLSLLVNCAILGSFYMTSKHKGSQKDFTVLFSNIYIYNNQSAHLLKFVKEHDPDVIAMAEVNDRMFGYYSMQLKENYPFAFHKRYKRSFGVAIFSKTQPSNEDIVQMYSDEALPSLKLSLQFANKPVDVIVTHPYPPLSEWHYNQRNGQLLGLAESVGKSSTSTVVVGDFNMTPWSPLFSDILEKGKLHNSLQGRGLQISWPTWAPSPMRIPIDHALFTDGLGVVNRQRGQSIGSDHLPIVVQFDVL